ncbi:protein SODIUM POTASSIUM ROOT DEFECTIVE 2-like isoform X1 [Apium graveolens]|uniref:protein SODIUM POTASSIUM ROOT DEFECTIVE 2-like isoform X1 n=1 Tax=Apium graveolens TaxID=4045 RepID=UPI003D7A042C
MAYQDRFKVWESSGVRIVPVLSQPHDSWTGERGFVQDAFSRDKKIYNPHSTGEVLCGHRQVAEVVVLRVSLHCRGCERKMRKHIFKMEGVTSFNIDFAAKKLTVVGNVTPLSVLASVSKVKKAQLLT